MTQHILKLKTHGRKLYDITAMVNEVIAGDESEIGLCNLFIQHTSASLIITENADPQVKKDLEKFINRLVPDGDSIFQHTAEGPDDMSAHVRTVLTQTSISIPIQNKKLALGTWQGVYVWEHRLDNYERYVMITIL